MNPSRVWKFALILFVLAGVSGLHPGRIGAQAPPTQAFPDTVTVSSRPKTNLFNHVMKRAEILAAFAQVQESRDLFVKNNAGITLRVSTNTTKLPWKLHAEADELWFVYRGSAKVSLAPFSLMVGVTPPGNTYDVGEGDIVNVPRGMAYQIMPAAGRFEYVAVRRFALQVSNTGSGRAGGAPQAQLPPVTTKAQLDQFFSTATESANLGSGINRIIYAPGGASYGPQPGGPFENHETDEHVYFVAYGTGKVTVDGFITGAHWDTRGVMGAGVVGGSEFMVGPGDMVFVFRNTVHYMERVPASGKVGYLLVGLTYAEPYWPKSIIPNGTGAY